MKSIVFLGVGIFLFYCGLDAKSAKNIRNPNDIPIPNEPIALGKTLTKTTISELSASGPIRNVVVEMVNHLDAPMTHAEYYLEYGISSIKPPDPIRGKTKEVFVFEKTGHTATGTTGMVVYKVEGISDMQFALIFSVPYNYIHASNWFGLKWIGRFDNAYKKTYKKMYYDPAWDSPMDSTAYEYASSNKPVIIYKEGYIIRASMTDSGRSVLRVDVYKEPEALPEPVDYDVETPEAPYQ